MSDDLVKRLWESDEASALTNQAARRIKELERGFWNLHREYDKRGDCVEELSNCVAVLEVKLKRISEEWAGAVYGDLENGVASLNAAAATDFYKRYPLVSAFGETLDRIIDGDTDA